MHPSVKLTIKIFTFEKLELGDVHIAASKKDFLLILLRINLLITAALTVLLYFSSIHSALLTFAVNTFLFRGL